MVARKKRLILGVVGVALGSLILANVLAYPRYFGAAVYFKWGARSGFSEIYVFPPSQEVGPLRRFLGEVIALEARPFIGSYMRKSGWEAAEGRFVVFSIPFPPVVTGLNRFAHWTLIDPKQTPLMHAADAGDLRSVKELLASGADVNAQDQRGWTPLMHASKSLKANAEVVRTLIAAGADVNARDNAGRTALIWAPLSGLDGAGKVSALLAAHADPNAKSNFGETPLERAVESPSLEAVSELLRGGADPNTRVLDNTTVLSIAERAGLKDLERLLKQAGARE